MERYHRPEGYYLLFDIVTRDRPLEYWVDLRLKPPSLMAAETAISLNPSIADLKIHHPMQQPEQPNTLRSSTSTRHFDFIQEERHDKADLRLHGHDSVSSADDNDPEHPNKPGNPDHSAYEYEYVINLFKHNLCSRCVLYVHNLFVCWCAICYAVCVCSYAGLTPRHKTKRLVSPSKSNTTSRRSLHTVSTRSLLSTNHSEGLVGAGLEQDSDDAGSESESSLGEDSDSDQSDQGRSPHHSHSHGTPEASSHHHSASRAQLKKRKRKRKINPEGTRLLHRMLATSASLSQASFSDPTQHPVDPLHLAADEPPNSPKHSPAKSGRNSPQKSNSNSLSFSFPGSPPRSASPSRRPASRGLSSSVNPPVNRHSTISLHSAAENDPTYSLYAHDLAQADLKKSKGRHTLSQLAMPTGPTPAIVGRHRFRMNVRPPQKFSAKNIHKLTAEVSLSLFLSLSAFSSPISYVFILFSICRNFTKIINIILLI